MKEYDPQKPEYNKLITDKVISEDRRLSSLQSDLLKALNLLYDDLNPFYSSIKDKQLFSNTSSISPYATALDFSVLYKNKRILTDKRRLQLIHDPKMYKGYLSEINAIQIAAYELFLKANYDPLLFDRYACILEGRYRMGLVASKYTTITDIRNIISQLKCDFMLDEKEKSSYIAKRVTFLLKNNNEFKILSPENMPKNHVFASQALCEEFGFSALKYRYFNDNPEIWDGNFEKFLKDEILNAPHIYGALSSKVGLLYTQEQYEMINDHDDFLNTVFSGDAFNLSPFDNSIFTTKGVQ